MQADIVILSKTSKCRCPLVACGKRFSKFGCVLFVVARIRRVLSSDPLVVDSNFISPLENITGML